MWAEPAESNWLTLIEYWLFIIKKAGVNIFHFFYLNQDMKLSSSESVTKQSC